MSANSQAYPPRVLMRPESEGEKMAEMDYIEFGKQMAHAYYRHPMRHGKPVTHRLGIKSTDLENLAKVSKALTIFIKDKRWHTTAKDVQEDAAKINAPAAMAFYGPLDDYDPILDAPPNTPEFVVIENPLNGDKQVIRWEDVITRLVNAERQLEFERRNRQTLPSAIPVPWSDTVNSYLQHLRTKGGHKGHPSNPLHVKNRETSLSWWQKILPDNLTLITTTKIEEGVQTAIKEFGRGGAVMRLDALKPMLEYACRLRLLKENPSKYIILKREEPEEDRKALSPEQLRILLAKTPLERSILYEVAAFTGLRKKELSSLRVFSFDRSQGTLLVRKARTKNKEGARQYLPEALAARLVAFCEGKKPDDALFTVYSHQDRRFRRDVIAAGLPNEFVFHSLRHTYDTNILDAGARPHEAMAAMRHSDSNLTLKRYGHASVGRMRELAEAAYRVVYK